MPSVLRIELLGGLRVRLGSHTVTRFRTEKTGNLLAFLAYHPQPHRRETLIEHFWPECPEDAGRNSLSTALWALKHDLAPLGPEAGEFIRADRNFVGIDPGRLETDVLEFHQSLAAARSASDPPARQAALAHAVALYRGELLQGSGAEWVLSAQSLLVGQFESALDELISLYTAAGALEPALELAHRSVSLDPLSEIARQRLCRLYLNAGQTRQAFQQYRELLRMLSEELDQPPSPETEALLADLLSGGRSPASGAPPPHAAGTPHPEPAVAPAEDRAPDELGGAVPLGSPFYVVRAADRGLCEALQRQEGLVLVKGLHQTGKTSLLARGLQHAREAGARVVWTDVQALSAAQVESLDACARALAGSLAEELDLDVHPSERWSDQFGPNQNLRRFLRRDVLGALGGRLVWGLDETDRLFGHPYASELFGLFRSWYNERALDPSGPWSRLTMVLAYATEAHLFVTDLNQSPFNVGVRLEVADFDLAQMDDLAHRYGLRAVDRGFIQALHSVLGGHPYLIRLAFHQLARGQARPEELLAAARSGRGVFESHLRRVLSALLRDPQMKQTVEGLLQGGPPPSEEAFYRLRSAGLLDGPTARSATFRCDLYRSFLQRHLTVDPHG